ncbi:putative structural protein [Rhizobium phage RHph_N17]|nr:putative structural protein [Rhizobium phage RHph_N17]
MTQSSAYSMKNVAATVNGQPVIGFWDGDDAVSVAPLADVGQMMVGADGSSIFSQSANEGATITLRLQHTSPTHKLLMQQMALQRARGIRLTGFPVSVIDTDSQEGGSTDQAFIQQAPTDTKGVNAQAREWVLVTGSWRPQASNA